MEPNGKDADEEENATANSRPLLPSAGRDNSNAKAAKILDACKKEDIEALRALATSQGGLVSDEIRRQAWPLLLGYASRDGDVKEDTLDDEGGWKTLPKHRDEDQVQLDVDRSFIYYPSDQSSKDLDRRKSELSDLITEVLRRQPYLSYFQGYHDICQVFLLVLEPHSRAPAVARLSALRIRDFMLPTFAQALAQLHLIPSIIHAVSPKLWGHLSGIQPFFALSGTLTMYAHDIQEYGDIARLFDVLLAREAVFSVYMFAQIVLQRSEELFETPADEPEMLHSILSKLPKPLDIETLITNTAELIDSHPPETLLKWRSISTYSVLKTARLPDQTTKQTLEDGERFFKKQVIQIQWAERRQKAMQLAWKYRRPAHNIGLAVFVGVLSFWLKRSSGPSGYFGALWRNWTGYQGH